MRGLCRQRRVAQRGIDEGKHEKRGRRDTSERQHAPGERGPERRDHEADRQRQVERAELVRRVDRGPAARVPEHQSGHDEHELARRGGGQPGTGLEQEPTAGVAPRRLVGEDRGEQLFRPVGGSRDRRLTHQGGDSLGRPLPLPAGGTAGEVLGQGRGQLVRLLTVEPGGQFRPSSLVRHRARFGHAIYSSHHRVAPRDASVGSLRTAAMRGEIRPRSRTARPVWSASGPGQR